MADAPEIQGINSNFLAIEQRLEDENQNLLEQMALKDKFNEKHCLTKGLLPRLVYSFFTGSHPSEYLHRRKITIDNREHMAKVGVRIYKEKLYNLFSYSSLVPKSHHFYGHFNNNKA